MAVVIPADVDVVIELLRLSDEESTVDQIILGTTYELLAAYLTVQDKSDIFSHGVFSFSCVA